MDKLPKDPYMLVSVINFLLRDEEFDTFEEICYNFNVDRKIIETELSKYGFSYDKINKRFW